MSLYYDAVAILSTEQKKGSLKSRVYSKDLHLKSVRGHIYALIKEVAKCDSFLKEVAENTGILKIERHLTPLLALLTIHDQCFNGQLQCTRDHPLRLMIERHKARIQAEFAKALLKRKLNRNESSRVIKEYFQRMAGRVVTTAPRWVRFNGLAETTAFIDRERTAGSVYWDEHIPGLRAFSDDESRRLSDAYENGELILQDKASCFPAYLLLGDQDDEEIGDCIDGCAAPGNKTTHMASLVRSESWKGQIFACERDTLRSVTLQVMVEKAHADKLVTILPRQDFLALDPMEERFANVTHLLLDPSCSGSGITKREDIPQFDLPEKPIVDRFSRPAYPSTVSGSKKRKRGKELEKQQQKEILQEVVNSQPWSKSELQNEMELLDDEEYHPSEVDTNRLQKLSNLQSMIVEHGMSFPAAKRLTYSTCSIHVEENEAVVERVLNSPIALSRGWRLQRRAEQVSGMQKWKHRGVSAAGKPVTDRERQKMLMTTTTHSLSAIETEACIRCWPNDGEGTMGFFVCGFIRDPDYVVPPEENAEAIVIEDEENAEPGDTVKDKAAKDNPGKEEVWEGFDDDILLGEKTALRPLKQPRKKAKLMKGKKYSR